MSSTQVSRALLHVGFLVIVTLITALLAVAYKRRKEEFETSAPFVCGKTPNGSSCVVDGVTDIMMSPEQEYLSTLTAAIKRTNLAGSELCIKEQACILDNYFKNQLGINCQTLAGIGGVTDLNDKSYFMTGCYIDLSQPNADQVLRESLSNIRAHDHKLTAQVIQQSQSRVANLNSAQAVNLNTIATNSVSLSNAIESNNNLISSLQQAKSLSQALHSVVSRQQDVLASEQKLIGTMEESANTDFNNAGTRYGCLPQPARTPTIQKNLYFGNSFPNINGHYTLVYKYATSTKMDPYTLWTGIAASGPFTITNNMTMSEGLKNTILYSSDRNYRNAVHMNHFFQSTEPCDIFIEVYDINNNTNNLLGNMMFSKVRGEIGFESWFNVSNILSTATSPNIVKPSYSSLKGNATSSKRWVITSTMPRNSTCCGNVDKITMMIPIGNCLSEPIPIHFGTHYCFILCFAKKTETFFEAEGVAPSIFIC